MPPVAIASSAVSNISAVSAASALSFHRRHWAISVVSILAPLLVIACTPKADKAAAAPAIREVGVVTMATEHMAFNTQLSGRTVAPVIAEIRPQVGGILQKLLFTEGSRVKAGQVLYQIDPASLQASYASAQASVRKAESTLATARTEARRNAELVKIDAISQQVNDQSQATALQAEADLGVSRAAEQMARINLGYTQITSPINGWAELSTVTPGALLTANQATALTTVQQLDPVYVNVTQSSSDLLRLKREFASGHLQRGDAKDAPIKLLLEDGSVYPHDGRLNFSGVTVDSGTGSVTLRAVVPNPEGLLMPGMYVRAVLKEGEDDAALLVPQQAVTRAKDGSASTLVVDSSNKVVRRPLTIGRAVGNRWQVLTGLAAGERVLVDGVQRVKVGDTVTVIELKLKGATPPANALSGDASASAAPASSNAASNAASGAAVKVVRAQPAATVR